VTEPGFWEGAVPVWGSGKSAVHHFEEGHWGRGTLYSVLAVSDVFLVKALVTGAGKIVFRGGLKHLVKVGGSHTHGATTSWMKDQGLKQVGQQAHHWLIPRKQWGRRVPDVIKNQPWNYKLLPEEVHRRLRGMYHGLPRYPAGVRWWIGTPAGAKAAEVSYGGRTVVMVMGVADDPGSGHHGDDPALRESGGERD